MQGQVIGSGGGEGSRSGRASDHPPQISSETNLAISNFGRTLDASHFALDVLHGLFEAYGDEEADDYGDDVDEEIAPGAGGVVRGVDVEHGGSSRLIRKSY
jgi:hypothetical protein